MKLLTIILILSSFAISYTAFTSDCLRAHNKYRNPLGLRQLSWSSSLARSAESYAQEMARSEVFKHSNNGDYIGENISYGTATAYSVTNFIDGWAAEKRFFIPGKSFPHCSTTGNQHDVDHYTQMVWKYTSRVGCGIAESSSGKSYFVCQYAPAGNTVGKSAY